jgi:hypothetical protein
MIREPGDLPLNRFTNLRGKEASNTWERTRLFSVLFAGKSFLFLIGGLL